MAAVTIKPPTETLAVFIAKEALKRVIDACCLLYDYSHRSEIITKSLFEADKYDLVFDYLKSKNEDFYIYPSYDRATELIKEAPVIMNYISDCLIELVKTYIKREVNSSKYVALVLYQQGPKIGTILRYAKDKILIERFIGFKEVINPVSVDQLFDHFNTTLKKYDITEKICAVSVDGSLLHIEQLKIFLNRVNRYYPHCLIMPWSDHNINYTLQKGISHIPDCNDVLLFLGKVLNFFETNNAYLKEMIFKSHRSLQHIYSHVFNDRHRCYNRFVSVSFMIAIKNFREEFLHLFDCIIKDKQNSTDIINLMYEFKDYLKQLKTVFLIQVITRILVSVQDIRIALEANDYSFCDGKKTNMVEEVFLKVDKLQFGRYGELWDFIKDDFPELKDKNELNNVKKLYYPLFKQITQIVIQEIEIRYRPLGKLVFLNMFNLVNQKNTEAIPLCVASLKETKRHMNIDHIKSELALLSNYMIYSRKSALEFYHVVNEDKLHSVFRFLRDVSELIIVTLKPTSVTNVSILDIAEKWYNLYVTAPHHEFCVLHMNYDIYQQVTQSLTFRDEIILIYKKKFTSNSR